MMPILKHKHTTAFTVIPNSLLNDTRLSLRDIGLICYMLHLPDNWEFSIAGLCAILKSDGRDSIATSLKRIEKASYLRRQQTRSESGKIGGVVWYISDIPMDKSPETENPYTVEPNTDSPNTGNPIERKKPFNQEKRDKERNEDAPLVIPFQGELAETFNDWVRYKREKRQSYKPTGLKSLITQVQKAVSEYGEHAVIDIIRASMANGYQGILFDRLKVGKPQQKPKNLTFYDLYLQEGEK